jgi:hypothetical protein
MANPTSCGNSPNNQFNGVGTGSFRPHSWFWQLCAGALLLFADGRNTIALAAWLTPALLLRFVRTHPARRGLRLRTSHLSLHAESRCAAIPIPGIFYYIFLVICDVSALSPHIADRLVAPHLKGVFKTLVLPAVPTCECKHSFAEAVRKAHADPRIKRNARNCLKPGKASS